MQVQYEDVLKTNEVSLAHLRHTINTNNLLSNLVLENNNIRLEVINDKKNTMNCIGAKISYKLSNIRATLKLYPSKIKINLLKEAEEKYSKIKEILDEHNILYDIHIHKKKITVNLLKIDDIYDINNSIYYIKNILGEKESYTKEPCKIHVTGIKNPKEWDNILEELLPLLVQNDITISSNYVEDIYYIMSNCIYNLGHKITLWNLVLNINKQPGFETAFCLYDNLRHSHDTNIIVPLEGYDIKSKMWSTHIEASFTIRTTGTVTQSCPSDELGRIMYYKFREAIQNMENIFIM